MSCGAVFFGGAAQGPGVVVSAEDSIGGQAIGKAFKRLVSLFSIGGAECFRIERKAFEAKSLERFRIIRAKATDEHFLRTSH